MQVQSQKRAQARPQQAATAQGDQKKPGLAAVEAVQGTGEPAARAVADILRAHSDERDDIMTWLHQHRGNAFVQQVTQHMGQVERQLPPGVELKSVNASIMIPGHRKLGGNWAYSAKTREATEVYVEVSTTGVRLSLQPGLYLDIDFPGRDCELESAGIDFATGKPFAHVADGGGIGVVPVKGMVSDKITHMIAQATAGTPLGKHYDPTRDPDLQGTLDKIVAGFTNLFHTEDPAAAPGKSPIAPDEMKRVSAGATVALKGPIQFMKDGTGITLDGGAPITIGVEGAGDIGALSQNLHDPQRAADALDVQAVRLSTEGLTVMAKGKPVAKLSALTLARGGKITIDQMQPLGKLADAEAMEAGVSLLAALAALHGGGDASFANGAYQNAQRPQVVDGVSRAMIEKQFTDTIHKLILQYRDAVPGLDLAKALGL